MTRCCRPRCGRDDLEQLLPLMTGGGGGRGCSDACGCEAREEGWSDEVAPNAREWCAACYVSLDVEVEEALRMKIKTSIVLVLANCLWCDEVST
jgi:hypothetical protein